MAAIAYVDPGNFAANFSAGAQYGYALLWVLVAANLMAMVVQYLSAKLGLVTGKSLPEVVAQSLKPRARVAYWLQAEIVAIATDLAEIIGGAIALHLLFGLPLLAGAIITSIVSLGLMFLYNERDTRVFEYVITGFLLIIPLGFFTGLYLSPPDTGDMLAGLMPHIKDYDMALLAAAMLGATVMPHVIYLHSAIVRDKHSVWRGVGVKKLLNGTKIDVGLALVFAGTVNIAMLLLAASALHGQVGMDTLEGIYNGLNIHVSTFVGGLFGVGLLASGFASAAVGSHAGSVIMDDLLHRRVAIHWRRLATIIPSIIVIGLGINATHALIVSQAILSFGIPFALIPLVLATSNRKLMGKYKNNTLMMTIAGLIAVFVVALNIFLLVLLAQDLF